MLCLNQVSNPQTGRESHLPSWHGLLQMKSQLGREVVKKQMPLLPIIKVPDPVLRQKAAPVTEIDAAVRQQLDDMAETMYEAPGIGLAANQVNSLVRLVVMDCAADEEQARLLQMVNPEIITVSEESARLEEGCLSIPGFTAEVDRPAEVTARWLDPQGAQQEAAFSGLEAACIQHEIDHLNGVLFIDHLSRLKRDMIWRKVLKEARSNSD
jgi:peptide deformylase